MHISLSPIRCDVALSLSMAGDGLTLNGDDFDFTALPEGATLPSDAILSDWFVGPVSRLNGEIYCTLALPHGPNAPAETLSPAPIHVTTNGPVSLPPYEV